MIYLGLILPCEQRVAEAAKHKTNSALGSFSKNTHPGVLPPMLFKIPVVIK